MFAVVTLFVCAPVTAFAAAVYVPSIGPVGGLLPIFKASFSPKALPENGESSPVTFFSGLQLRPSDGSRPPALQEVVLELDRHISFDAIGVPVCRPGNVDEPLPSERCRAELIGRGKMTIEVAFSEQKPFVAKSKLLAFNGGIDSGTTTIYIQAYFGPPLSAATVITFKVTKVDKGRYGTRWVAVVPRIAGGSGSIVGFSLKLGKHYRYRREEKSLLGGRCPDRHLSARARLAFVDGSVQSGSVVRPCIPKP